MMRLYTQNKPIFGLAVYPLQPRRVVHGQQLGEPGAGVEVAGAALVLDFAQLVVRLPVTTHVNRPIGAQLV